MAQQKRGFKFALSKTESLLKVIKGIIPIGNPDWDKILNKHASCYPTKDCTAKLLKRKFQKLACTEIPTRDPNMPPHICKAKHIYYKIVLAIYRSTGGSEDGGHDLDNERDGECEEDEKDDDEEGGMVEIINNSFSFSADEEQVTMDDDNGSQLDAVVAAAAASGRRASDRDQSSVLAILSGKRRVGGASSSKEMRDGGQKKAVSFLCPLKPQGRSLLVIRMTAMTMDFCSGA